MYVQGDGWDGCMSVLPSFIIAHTQLSHPPNTPTHRQNCVYDPFALTMKKSSKPGMGDKFQLAIVGDYPTRCVRVVLEKSGAACSIISYRM